jgi:phenylacetate-CoA ligase
MAPLEMLYLKLPPTLQHVGCSLEGWRVQRRRYGRGFRTLLREAEQRTFWSRDEVQAYRDLRLRALVDHCVQTVPFYRRQFKDLGLTAHDIRSIDDLRHLPVLSKHEVQTHGREFVSEVVPKQLQTIAHTSGTTGGGLRFATTWAATQEQWATWWRYRRWHGIELDTWCGYFGGRSVVPLTRRDPPLWRYNFPGRQILFSGYHMSPDSLGAYVTELRAKRPTWLHGYPSLLALLGAYILEFGIDLGYQVQSITLGAENLLPQQREVMERAFGVRPRQHYGMAEAVANISECPEGALHVDEDFAVVEFVPVAGGNGYKVIGTNLTNPATPLLRYDVADIASLDDTSCSCGRPGRIVAAVDGRQEDYVVLKTGARLGRLDHVFKDMVRIREAQIYQKDAGAITLRIAPAGGFTVDDEVDLLHQTRKRVGDDIEITIQYVDRLERSRTGKLRFVVSELAGGRLAEAVTASS